MDTIRREIGAITEGEKALLRQRDTQVEEAERWVRLVAILIGLASVATRAAVEFWLTRRGLDVRVVAPDGTPLPHPPA
jgi:methyl-accepting chemotaxis protein